jgi:CheY-like chemotaxis protein
MDCHMPVMDGFEATRKIRELVTSAKLKSPVIIGYSGISDAEEQKKGLAAGMDKILIKGGGIEVLQSTLSDIGNLKSN